MVFPVLNTSNTRARKARTRRPGPPNQAAAPALKWLVLDETGASMLATAQNLVQAEQVIRGVLPPMLAPSCRVANIDRQCLTLAVPAAAHATRLRQLTPTLLRALTQHGWNLTQIEIRVQASLASFVKKSPPRDIRPLDRGALDCFHELQQNVQPGPLAEAIERLLNRHDARKR